MIKSPTKLGRVLERNCVYNKPEGKSVALLGLKISSSYVKLSIECDQFGYLMWDIIYCSVEIGLSQIENN